MIKIETKEQADDLLNEINQYWSNKWKRHLDKPITRYVETSHGFWFQNNIYTKPILIDLHEYPDVEMTGELIEL